MHLIGILLGPVSLHAINLSSHELGWLEKGDFPPVALSWQADPWCPSLLRRGFAFSALMGACFCPLPTSVKSNWWQKSAWLPQGKFQALSLYSWMGENVFSPLAMSCKFSLRLPVLIVRRDLFFHPPLNSGKGRSCLGRERIESRLGKPVRLGRWGHVPSCAVIQHENNY